MSGNSKDFHEGMTRFIEVATEKILEINQVLHAMADKIVQLSEEVDGLKAQNLSSKRSSKVPGDLH